MAIDTCYKLWSRYSTSSATTANGQGCGGDGSHRRRKIKTLSRPSHSFQGRNCQLLTLQQTKLPKKNVDILNSSLCERVDKMVDKGMVNEVRNVFNPRNQDYSSGIRKAIDVPEFDRYFQAELSKIIDEETRVKLLEEAINEVKINNCKLASQQLKKINHLINVKGWNVHRLDAT
ncbi:hypothetical protein RND71_006962 [Anisodus tanguticus]|uniref:adenylate dimethylallyltransferase (ADP/ATP-dependent) n=1 Tax=Anisodus tanguticus TaxID=243964 RepID=A0AAE1VWL0_9SOLA|nr:hypothetical protein RND71_006962 [Anisodus tanguticus]